MKLTLYLFIGSVVSLVGALVMYWMQYKNTGILSFDMLVMENAGFSQAFQNLWFLAVFFGFAVLGGSGPSTTGRQMVTLPNRPPFPCSMRAC